MLAHRPGKPVSVRVGVDESPPFYTIGKDGSVRGLAVDVLNEAARRTGIRLQWVPLHDIPIDDALGHGIVDLWPLVGVTPARRSALYLTRPWIESDYVLVSLRESPVLDPEAATGKTVAHARLRYTTLIADQFLPRSIPVVRILRSEALQALCHGEASAALLESNVLDAIMLARPPGCENAAFRISNLTGATTPLCIAAVRQMAPAADRLRSAIEEMGADGFLSARMDLWSPFAAQGTRSILARESAERVSRIYRFCLVAILLLTVVLGWVTWRSLHLRRAAAAAEAGRLEIQRRFTAFMDHSPALAFMKDAAGRLLYVNKAWTQVFRMSAEEVHGKSDFDLWPKSTARRLRTTDEALLRENRPQQALEQVPVPGSSSHDWLIVKFPFTNHEGEQLIGGTAVDVTERETALRDLAASETRYRELFEHNPLPAWVYDRETLAFLTVNEAAIRSYGWTREDFLSGMTLLDVLWTEEPCFASGDGAVIDAAQRERGTWQHMTKLGQRLNVGVTSYELDYNHRPARLSIVRDLTDQERMLEQLRTSEERWQLALRGAGDALWDWDLETNRIYRSPRWATMLGYAEHEIGDTREEFLKLLHPDDIGTTLTAVEEHLARVSTGGFLAEYRLRHKDGSWRWVLDRGQAVWDERGLPIRMAGSQTDITARKAAESLLTLQARTDALTGVCNRREFERLFAGHFLEARLRNSALSVCICDLDRFKEVNDRHGHPVGDRVLIAFAVMLRAALRKTDLPARMGGDEFVISMPNTTADEAVGIVERIRHALKSHLFDSPGGHFCVTASFGVAELLGDHGDSQSLLADADRLLYDAKGGGRDRTLAA